MDMNLIIAWFVIKHQRQGSYTYMIIHVFFNAHKDILSMRSIINVKKVKLRSYLSLSCLCFAHS